MLGILLCEYEGVTDGLTEGLRISDGVVDGRIEGFPVGTLDGNT